MRQLLAAEDMLGNTWGIPGPAFLGIYAVLFGVIVIVVVLSRRGPRSSSALADDPSSYDHYELAYLNGGEKLVAFTALYNLYDQGVVRATNDAVSDGATTHLDAQQFAVLSAASGLEAVADLPANAHPIERTAYELVVQKPGTRPSALLRHVEKQSTMRLLAGDMIRRGLVRSKDQRMRIRLTGLWFLPLIALGIVRADAGAENGKPIEFLLVFLVVTVLALILGLGAVGRTTAAGRRLLKRAQTNHGVPAASATASLAAPTAMAVALFGTEQLWASHPELATALAAKPVRSSSHDGGSSWLGAFGSSGGSSCGGGGGCGGGGCGG